MYGNIRCFVNQEEIPDAPKEMLRLEPRVESLWTDTMKCPIVNLNGYERQLQKSITAIAVRTIMFIKTKFSFI